MARTLDINNGNTAWEDALKSMMKDLFNLESFDIKSFGFTPGDNYQKTTLTIIYDVKQDLTRQARLVAGGHLVDPLDHSVHDSSTVKGISVKLLHVIAHKADLSQLCGDVLLAFVNALTNKLVYAIAGPEFGEHEGKPVVIRKALYGLCTSAERWHSSFAGTLWSLGFKQTRFDNDVWIRLNIDGNVYDYLCTHVDNFMICAKDAKLYNGSHQKSLHYQGHWTTELLSWDERLERQARMMVNRMQKVPKRGRQAS
jgi:hypothetical protein